VADRLRRRPLLVAANLAAGAGVCALLLVHGASQIWLIYLVMFGYGAASSLITSAQTALLAALMVAITVPQAASIALGAALIAVVDYHVLLVVMAAVIVASAAYLVGGPDPAAQAPAGPAAPPVAGEAVLSDDH
jgi:hypothetical protein